VPEEEQHVRLVGVLNGSNFPEQKDTPAPDFALCSARLSQCTSHMHYGASG
jgi:hypothetical protein